MHSFTTHYEFLSLISKTNKYLSLLWFEKGKCSPHRVTQICTLYQIYIRNVTVSDYIKQCPQSSCSKSSVLSLSIFGVRLSGKPTGSAGGQRGQSHLLLWEGAEHYNSPCPMFFKPLFHPITAVRLVSWVFWGLHVSLFVCRRLQNDLFLAQDVLVSV